MFFSSIRNPLETLGHCRITTNLTNPTEDKHLIETLNVGYLSQFVNGAYRNERICNPLCEDINPLLTLVSNHRLPRERQRDGDYVALLIDETPFLMRFGWGKVVY